MDRVLYLALGGVIMLFLTPLAHPLTKRLESLSRRMYGIKPISIHIERDTSIVWAGHPNWIGAFIWLPSLPSTTPPEHPTDWHSWAQRIGGTDASTTFLKVTITCRESASVVVSPPKIRRDSLPVGSPPKGVILVNPTGGASVTPRRIKIDLDMAYADWIDEDGAPLPTLSLALEAGETEQFYIFAHADVGRYEWHIELPVIVDGRREILRIDDDGKRFITHGTAGLTEYLWRDDQWTRRGD
ncbi:hypothetical protein [Streptomyces sp. BH104]|uniref:hypothetical protein n=1 Tax=Streptomyces sp. BH104 TaxID=3410407 RepID=UPI003BB62BC2